VVNNHGDRKSPRPGVFLGQRTRVCEQSIDQLPLRLLDLRRCRWVFGLCNFFWGEGEVLPHPPPKKKIDITDIDIQIYTGPRNWNPLWETSSSKLRTDRNGEKKAEYEYTAVHIPVRTLKHRYLQYICTISKLVALQRGANVKSWPYEYLHATLKWFGWSSWDCCRRLRSLVIHWVCLGFRSESSLKGR